MQRLQHDLGKSLGRAHHIGWIDGLVGGDEDEGLDFSLVGGLGGVPGGDHVVVDSLDDVLLDNGDMLVSGSVVDGLNAVGLKNVTKPMFVMCIAEQPDQVHRALARFQQPPEFALDVVQRNLRHLK